MKTRRIVSFALLDRSLQQMPDWASVSASLSRHLLAPSPHFVSCCGPVVLLALYD